MNVDKTEAIPVTEQCVSISSNYMQPHRLLSSKAETKELPEVRKPNRDLRGRKSVHVQLEQ